MRNKEYRDSFVSANISNTISAQIHTMRQVRGWTQSDLAARCNMRQPRISTLEDPEFENVEIATLKRIASAFDVALVVQFVPYSHVVRLSSSMKPSDFDVSEYKMDLMSEKSIKPFAGYANYNAYIANVTSSEPISIELNSGTENKLIVTLPLERHAAYPQATTLR